MSNSLRLTAIALLLAVSNLSAATLYVSLESANPTPPYTNWFAAATNIQQAVDAAAAADEVVVTNGVYRGGLTVTNPLTLRSVNGPQFTVIAGRRQYRERCAYLSDGASLTGFTLTNGVSLYAGGGGVWCTSTNAFLTNCTLTGNYGGYGSGGARGGTLYNCTLTGNIAGSGGGAAGSTLYNCTLSGNSAGLGGGATGSTLYNCTLSGNSADSGGGANLCRLYNCTLSGNSADGGGGGVRGGTLYNCTLTGNTADSGGAASWCREERCILYNCTLSGNSAGRYGGGAIECILNNCIVYFNTCPNGANYAGGSLNYSCSTPLPPDGVGNIDTDPLFVDFAGGNLRLQSSSPCINAGNNEYVVGTTDLDGDPRISGGVADMGAYECVFTPSMEVARLILLVNGSDLGAKNKHPLLATLSAAMASFGPGNLHSGANQLHAFQNKVRAQVARMDAVLANELIQAAEQIIEEVANH